MILAIHIVIAAAATKPLIGTHPVATLLASIASHYIADAVPHWHYPTRTLPKEREDKMTWTWRGDRKTRVGDFLRFAADGTAGIILALVATQPASAAELWWIGAAAAGSMLPDALQGLYFAGARFLAPHQIFHDRLHAGIKLDAYPLIGIPFQAAIGIIAIYFLL